MGSPDAMDDDSGIRVEPAFEDEKGLIQSLAKIGCQVARQHTTTVLPQMEIDIENIQEAIRNIQIASLPPKLLHRKKTTRELPFPCMDKLIWLVHKNPLALDSMTEEFLLFLQRERAEENIPDQELPSATFIKKRIRKIANYDFISDTKIKAWHVYPGVMKRFVSPLQMGRSAGSWNWRFGDLEARYKEVFEKEESRVLKLKEKHERRSQREAEDLERKRQKELKKQEKEKAKLAREEEFRQKRLAREAEAERKRVEAEKRKAEKEARDRQKQEEKEARERLKAEKKTKADDLPGAPNAKRVKLSAPDQEKPKLSPNVEKTTGLMRHMKLMTAEERKAQIKHTVPSLLPEPRPLSPVGSPPGGSKSQKKEPAPGESLFGIPTQEGINKLFKVDKENKSRDEDDISAAGEKPDENATTVQK